MIGVKNTSDEVIEARYDGQDFVFEPGVTTACSEEAAAHIFGYGVKDKARALHRLGWMRHGGDIKEAVRKLDKFAFLAAEEPTFKDEKPTTLHVPKKDAPDIPMHKAPDGQRQVAVK